MHNHNRLVFPHHPNSKPQKNPDKNRYTLYGVKFNPARPSRLHEHYKGFKNFYFNTYKCAWGEPAPTITQSGNQLGGRGGICHPEEDRTYTIRELKRLSALPDDFKLTGTFNQQAERIGRMVPPLMTTAIAESVYENIIRGSH